MGGIKALAGVNIVDSNGADFNIGDVNSQASTGSIDYLPNLYSLIFGFEILVTGLHVK